MAFHALAKVTFVAVMMGATTMACSPTKNLRGYLADPVLVGAIQPGIDNAQSVEGTLGRPSLVSEFDNSTWYYVSQKTRQWAFFNERPSDQDILAIRFDPSGNVASVDHIYLDDRVGVSPVGAKTPVRGKEASLLQQFFGGIGAVGAGGLGGAGPQGPGPGF